MKCLLSAVLLILAVCLAQAQLAGQTDQIPAFHSSPPAKSEVIPPLLTEKQITNEGFTQPGQIGSYKAAAKIPEILYQLPCYCGCDKGHGHTSLRSCYESGHAANCGPCMKEAIYAYKMTKQGWTPKMIRDGIIRGDWKVVDLQLPEPVDDTKLPMESEKNVPAASPPPRRAMPVATTTCNIGALPACPAEFAGRCKTQKLLGTAYVNRAINLARTNRVESDACGIKAAENNNELAVMGMEYNAEQEGDKVFVLVWEYVNRDIAQYYASATHKPYRIETDQRIKEHEAALDPASLQEARRLAKEWRAQHPIDLLTN